jgi:predicted dehydrogenase
MTQKRRYAVVGTGGRMSFFTDSLLRDYADHADLVGLCDVSQTRMDFHNRRFQERFGRTFPTYAAADFGRMLDETKPDVVIVTCIDREHHAYVIEALRRGLDAITEKPMTIDAPRCRAIMEAVEQTGRNLRVAFNYRWGAYNSRVKEVLVSGAVGTIKTINVEYLLDTRHGADYFRRWHSSMADCGGLLVHKSTHHFDLVNWFVDSVPQQVFAYGDLFYYGKRNAVERGDERLTRYDRYTGHVTKAQDPFALDLRDGKSLEGLYYNAEAETGYRRDMNVFRDGIDIYDHMSVNVRYRSGVILTYSLTAFSPREGMRVTVNGDRGRLEYYEFGGSHIIKGQDDAELAAEQARDKGEEKIVVYPHFKPPYHVEVNKTKGGHGGGDPKLIEQIYHPNPTPDPLHRNAGHEQGAASILIGAAANLSIKENRPIDILDLVNLRPDAVRLRDLI